MKSLIDFTCAHAHSWQNEASSIECRAWCVPLMPFNLLYVAIQHPGSLYPSSRLKRAFSSVVHMFNDSFMTNSMVSLARRKTLVSVQLIEWSFVQACLAMADLSVRHLIHASLCSVFLACTWSPLCTPYHKCMVLRKRCSISEKRVGGSFAFVRRLQRVSSDLNNVLML